MEPVGSGNENLEEAGIVTSDGEHISSTSLRTSESNSSSSEFEEGTPSPLSKICSRLATLADKIQWVRSSNGNAPPGSFVGGHNVSNETMYVARAPQGGDLIPGKLIPAIHSMYVGWRLREFKKNEYEVLISGPYTWIPGSRGLIGHGAVPAGKTKFGETLYIGRVSYGGAMTTGKVQESAGGCYIPFNSKELFFQFYEILVFSHS